MSETISLCFCVCLLKAVGSIFLLHIVHVHFQLIYHLNNCWIHIQFRDYGNQTEKIFFELYRTHKQVLYIFLFNKVRSSEVAEDILHDVFLKFWMIRDSYDTIENDKAFLFRMAFNEANNYFDRQRNLRAIYKAISPNEAFFNSTDETLYQKELEVLLQKTINQLPPRRKQVYVLCKLQGMSHLNVASLLKISPRTVKEMMRISNGAIRKAL